MFSRNSSNIAKGIAIALLLFHHLFYSADRVAAGGESFALIPYPLVQTLAVCARVCVYVFVFVSAYGLTAQYEKKSAGYPIRFILSHWLSLMQSFWPVYLVVFFARSFVDPDLNPMAVYGFSKAQMVFDFLGWADLFGTPLILSAWWYMCFAQLLVICVPLISKFCRALRGYTLPIVAIATFLFPGAIDSPFGGNYLMYAFVACAGVLVAQGTAFNRAASALHTRLSPLQRLGVATALTLLSLALPLLNLKLRDTMDFWQVSGILNGLSAIIICFLASLARAESRFGQVLAAFGRYSAAMFMFHPFLYTYVPKLIYWPGEALLCYLVFFLLSLLFSIAIGLLKKVCAYDRAFSSLRLRIEARVNI